MLGADDDSIAESLRHSVRVLCWIMTTPDNHMSRAVHVQATWGRRCNVLLFVTEKDDVGALAVMKVDVATGREHLTAKTMSAFDHLYEHHLDEADWFLKVRQALRWSMLRLMTDGLLIMMRGMSSRRLISRKIRKCPETA